MNSWEDAWRLALASPSGICISIPGDMDKAISSLYRARPEGVKGFRLRRAPDNPKHLWIEKREPGFEVSKKQSVEREKDGW